MVFPSRYAHLEVGEDAFKYPLPFDEVKARRLRQVARPVVRPRRPAREVGLARESRAGVPLPATGHRQDGRARPRATSLSLNEGERREERDSDKKRVEEIKAERVARHLVPPPTYALPLSDVDKPKLTLMPVKKDKDKACGRTRRTPTAPNGEDSVAEDLDEDGGTAKADVIDPAKTESLNILEDMIEQTHGKKLAAKTQD